MRPLTTGVIQELLKKTDSPCISIYQPTHRSNPDALQDPIRYKNLLREAERSLREKYSGREVRPLLEPFEALEGDYLFWMHQRDGLAALGSADSFELFQLQRPVPELAVVADSFHLKPLLRMVQSGDRYQILCIDQKQAQLFEGNRDAVDDVDMAGMPVTIETALGEIRSEPYQRVTFHGKPGAYAVGGGRRDEIGKVTEQFFRAIDRGVYERFSRPSGLPLILAALPEHHAMFRKVSSNPQLQPEGVTKDPWSMDREQLRTEVWRTVEPNYLARLNQLIDDFRLAASRNRAASSVVDVARAAASSRIGVLLVDADREIPGKFDPSSGEVRLERLADPRVDDLIDDLMESVLKSGGNVVVVPAARMPSDTGVAATFRH